MKFSEAMKLLEEGKKVRRPSYYDGRTMCVSEMDLKWHIISAEDIMATDWEEVEASTQPMAQPTLIEVKSAKLIYP